MPRHPKPVWTPGASFVINPASPQAQGLLGWWPELAMRGTRTYQDRISYNHGSPNDVQITLDLDAERGWAWRFPYINNTYVEVPRINASLDIGAGSYTVSLWVYLESGILATSSYVCVATMRDSANYTGWILALYPQTDATHPNKLLFGVAATHAGPYPTALANATFPTARWVHVAGVVDRKSQVVKLYLDGVPQTTTASIAALGAINGTKPIRLGYESGLAAFKGRQSDLRIYGRALSDQEIYQLYAPETRWDLYRSQLHRKFPLFPQPETHRTGRRPQRALAGIPSTPYRLNPYSRQRAGLVGCWAFLQARGCNNVIDLARNQTAPFTNTPVWQPDPELGYVLKFNGEGASTTKYLALPNTATVGGLDEVTVAVWYKPTANPTDVASYPPLWFESTGSTDYTRFGIFHISNTSNLLVVVRDSVAGNTGSATVNTTLTSAFSTLNVWYHVVVTYSAVQDRLRIYLNGVLRSTVTGTYGTLLTVTPSNPISLGGIYGSAGQQRSLTGCLGLDARMYSRELSAAEVYQLYAPETRWDLYGLVKRMSLLWTEVVTSTLYYQALDATLGQVASLLRAPHRLLTGTQATLATLPRLVGRGLTGSQSTTATALRHLLRSLLGTQAQTATHPQQPQRSLAASTTHSSTLTRQTQPNLPAGAVLTVTLTRLNQRVWQVAQAGAATVVRAVERAVAATSSLVGTLGKGISQSYTGNSLTAATLGVLKTRLLELTASLTPLSTLVRQVSRFLTGTQSATATRLQQVARTLSSSTALSPTFSRALALYYTVTQSATAGLTRGVALLRTPVSSGVATLTRHVEWLRSGAATLSPTLLRAVAQGLTALQDQAATLTSRGVLLVTLQAVGTAGATLQRATDRLLTSTQAQTATSQRALGRALATTALTAALLTRQGARDLAATQGQTATNVVSRAFLRTLAPTVTPLITLVRALDRIFLRTQATTATRPYQVSRERSVTQGQTATSVRQQQRSMATSTSLTASLLRLVGKGLIPVQTGLATCQRALTRALSLTQELLARHPHQVDRALSGSTAPVGTLQRQFSRFSTATLTLLTTGTRFLAKTCHPTLLGVPTLTREIRRILFTPVTVVGVLTRLRQGVNSAGWFFMQLLRKRRD
jgi:hypothetical protein